MELKDSIQSIKLDTIIEVQPKWYEQYPKQPYQTAIPSLVLAVILLIILFKR